MSYITGSAYGDAILRETGQAIALRVDAQIMGNVCVGCQRRYRFYGWLRRHYKNTGHGRLMVAAMPATQGGM